MWQFYSSLLFVSIIRNESYLALESIIPQPHMASGNILQSRASRKGHGKLKLIFQHFNDSSNPRFTLCCQPVYYRSSNLPLQNIKKTNPMIISRQSVDIFVTHNLTKTAWAPSANALNTSVPRLNPPSKRTGILPLTASTTCTVNFKLIILIYITIIYSNEYILT